MHPEFLWALLLLLIPIIIHLFSFRKFRTVYFSNVKFLKEVKEENAARSRLKHLLVLFSRLLAVFFLVMAFAQPYIPATESKTAAGPKAVSIYLDNSFSMEANGSEVSLLKQAKDAALKIMAAYGNGDRFQLLTNDFEGRQQRLLDQEEFREYLKEIDFTPRVKRINQIVARQRDALKNEKNSEYFLLSDFQKNISIFPKDTGLSLFVVAMKAVKKENISIDSVWLQAPVNMPGQTARLFVKIVNYGESPVESDNVSLLINGQRKALADFSIEAGASYFDTLTFTVPRAGWNAGTVEINDYPVTFDDHYYFTFYSPPLIRILTLEEGPSNPYISAIAVADFTRLDKKAAGQVDYSEFGLYDLIILNGLTSVSSGMAAELQRYIENGGKVLLFPNENMDRESYNRFLRSIGADPIGDMVAQKMELKDINRESEFYSNVFEEIPKNLQVPEVRKYYRINKGAYSKGEELLTLKNNDPLLARYPFGSGFLYLMALPPDPAYSDLPRHSLFAVTLIQTAISGISTRKAAITIGRPESLTVPVPDFNSEENLKLEYEGAERMDFFPKQRLLGRNVILNFDAEMSLDKAGIYRLYRPGSDSLIQLLAFNYDRRESDISTYTIEELKELYPNQIKAALNGNESDLGKSIENVSRGKELWRLALVLVLLFLFVETLLLRFLPE